MIQSPASGYQVSLDHSPDDPLIVEPGTASHHNHPSTDDNWKDDGYTQSCCNMPGLQNTAATPPESTVRPSSTYPTPWAITNLIALSRGSSCHSESRPRSLPEDFNDLLDRLSDKGPQFLALEICYDLFAYLNKTTNLLSLNHIDAYVKDFLPKVKAKSGGNFRQITPKTKPDAGTQMVEALCLKVKCGQLDPRTHVLEYFCLVIKSLGLDPELRESDLVQTPEMLLALILGLILAQIGAVVPPDTPILGVCKDIVDQYCTLTNRFPNSHRPPPPPRPLQRVPTFKAPEPLPLAILRLVLFSQALWVIPICLAMYCLSTSKPN